MVLGVCCVGAADDHTHTTVMSGLQLTRQGAANMDMTTTSFLYTQIYFLSVCGILQPHNNRMYMYTPTCAHTTHTTHTTHTLIRWLGVRGFPMSSMPVYGVGLTSTRMSYDMLSSVSMRLTSSVTVCVSTHTTTSGLYLRSDQKQVQRSSYHMT